MKNGDRIKNQFSRQSDINRDLINNAPYPIPDILYEDNYELDLGGLTVQLMSVGPLHTEGDSIIFIEEELVLFSGDVIMGGIIPSIDQEHSSFDSWKTAIDRIAMLSPQFIIGSHGDIGDQTLIDIWDSLISEISVTLSEYRSLGFSKSKAVRELTLLLNQKFPEWRNDRRRMASAVESVYR
jgi:cyclase